MRYNLISYFHLYFLYKWLVKIPVIYKQKNKNKIAIACFIAYICIASDTFVIRHTDYRVIRRGLDVDDRKFLERSSIE